MTWSPSVQAISAEVDRNLGASACSSGSSSFLDITKNAQSSAAFAPFFSFHPFRKMATGRRDHFHLEKNLSPPHLLPPRKVKPSKLTFQTGVRGGNRVKQTHTHANILGRRMQFLCCRFSSPLIKTFKSVSYAWEKQFYKK
jgi:hypothetical protein